MSFRQGCASQQPTVGFVISSFSVSSRPLSRRALFQNLAAAPLTLFLQSPKKRPNVLFLAVDDLNTRLGCYDAEVKSPHVDALARSGVRFERAYCQYPLCNPSRTSLLTGRRPPTTQVMDNQRWIRQALPDVVTLPQHFRENGYVTAQTGKIFHGGLDDDRAWTVGGQPHTPSARRTPQEQAERQARADRWVAVEGEGEDQPDYRTASRAIELLRELRDRPFFLAAGFVKPHVPFIAPKKYFDLYDPARMRLPADFSAAPASTSPSHRPNFDIFIRREASADQARQAIAAYYAAISFMDAQVGRVLGALDQLGLREQTAIVFFGDHGFHLGEKGMWSKMTVFEASARVPLIFSVPWTRSSNKVCPRPVELVDLYPTLAEICGLPAPPGLEGKSLISLLKNPAATWDKPAYTFVRRGQVLGASVRTERFRYTEWDGGRGGAELYDHQSDPSERRNLASDPGYSEQVAGLKQLLRKAMPLS